MITHIGKRVLWMLAMMLVLSFVTFSLMQLSPVDPVTLKFQLQGANYDADTIAAMQKSLGLDRPFLEQYSMWLGNIVTGHLGVSIFLTFPL